jgi:hypothetical protein
VVLLGHGDVELNAYAVAVACMYSFDCFVPCSHHPTQLVMYGWCARVDAYGNFSYPRSQQPPSYCIVNEGAIGTQCCNQPFLCGVVGEFKNVFPKQRFATAQNQNRTTELCDLIDELFAFSGGKFGWGVGLVGVYVTVSAVEIAFLGSVP